MYVSAFASWLDEGACRFTQRNWSEGQRWRRGKSGRPLLPLLIQSTERNEIAATCATIKCYRVGGGRPSSIRRRSHRTIWAAFIRIYFDRCNFEQDPRNVSSNEYYPRADIIRLEDRVRWKGYISQGEKSKTVFSRFLRIFMKFSRERE